MVPQIPSSMPLQFTHAAPARSLAPLDSPSVSISTRFPAERPPWKTACTAGTDDGMLAGPCIDRIYDTLIDEDELRSATRR